VDKKASGKKNRGRIIALCGIFTALIIVGTFIRIPIPGVPFTLQFFFVNLSALVLGKRWGTLSVFVYIILGLAGIPVFASGGGPDYIFRPTFGYLLGFIVGTIIAGTVYEGNKSVKNAIKASILNMLTVYAVGIIYYYLISRYHLGEVKGLHYLVFGSSLVTLPGDIISCVITANISKHLSKIIDKQ